MAETANMSNMPKMAIVLEVQMPRRQDGLMAKLLDGFMAMWLKWQLAIYPPRH